jgi:pimeloyl-ACP methyl ester carboxylesterase
MTTAPIILVPGFWLGAWAWDEVAAALRADGHDVTALTLPGLESADNRRSHDSKCGCEFLVGLPRCASLAKRGGLSSSRTCRQSYQADDEPAGGGDHASDSQTTLHGRS